MVPTDKKSRNASKHAWTEDLGIGRQSHRPQESPYKRKEKSVNLCNEQGCANPNAYWVKFVSGRMGFYCEEHKDQMLRKGLLVRVEYFEK